MRRIGPWAKRSEERRRARLLAQALDEREAGAERRGTLAAGSQSSSGEDWLKPSLNLARSLSEQAIPGPSAASQQRGWTVLQAALREQRVAERASARRKSPRLAWAGSLALAVVAIGALVEGTFHALPDSPLYGARLALESAPVVLARDPEARATAQLQYAQNRLADAQAEQAKPGGAPHVEAALAAARGALAQVVYERSLSPQADSTPDPVLLSSFQQLARVSQATSGTGVDIQGQVNAVQDNGTLLVGGLPVQAPGATVQPGDWVQADVIPQPDAPPVANAVTAMQPPVAYVPPTETPTLEATASPEPSLTPTIPGVLGTPVLPVMPLGPTFAVTPSALPSTATLPAASGTPVNATVQPSGTSITRTPDMSPTAAVTQVPTRPLPTRTSTPGAILGTPVLPSVPPPPTKTPLPTPTPTPTPTSTASPAP